MSNYQTTWETYAASWKAESAADKRALYKEALSEDCVYTDPLVEARGWDELEAYMLEFHQQIPGGHFVTIEFMAHHRRSLATWEMRDADGKTMGNGTSYGAYDASGKLVSMNGFFEPPGG